ncbi:hypothetical protein [Oceanobacillus alkalisoli]|uniref:hypothetical protein n=1 Tax=Oceanobacillus alkalisoli TaxID=2925113 RepID=UPI001F11B91F|nr:hypothetical protein [Oceanobacillus alkalisoli]MCF3943105.1 hypothetical protein [Oceanobacillus alkalisoli]
MQEELTEIVEIDHVYDEHDVTLDLVNHRLFIKMENGIMAYDATTYELLWTDAYGTIADRETEENNHTYTMYNVYTDDYIYAYTDGLGSVSTPSKHLFSVIDAATGEVLEHYNLRRVIKIQSSHIYNG